METKDKVQTEYKKPKASGKPRPIDGNPPAKKVLTDLVETIYSDAWEAKERGELIAWTSSKFPIEIAKPLVSTAYIQKTTLQQQQPKKMV